MSFQTCIKKETYDLIVVANNLNKSVNNTNLVYDIYKKFPEFNKVIIGSSHLGKDFSGLKNTHVYDNLPSDEVQKLVSKSKILLVTSYFESSSISLLEGLHNKCKIVCSSNVGFSMILPDICICQDTYDAVEWIIKISSLMSISTIKYKLPNTEKSHSFLKLITNFMKNDKTSEKIIPLVHLSPLKETHRETIPPNQANLEEVTNSNELEDNTPIDESLRDHAVGIYKVPAGWNAINSSFETIKPVESINHKLCTTLKNFSDHLSTKISIPDDIYLNLFIKLMKARNITVGHYIFIDESVVTAKLIKINNVNIWILKSIEEVLYFKDASMYFLRGKYPNFYNNLVEEDSYVFYYPATSLRYNYGSGISNKKSIDPKNIIRRITHKISVFNNKVNKVLVHEDKNYCNLYSSNKMVIFKKFASSHYYYLNKPRSCNYIFVADATQPTKNHKLLFDFMDYCESKQLKITFVYISLM